MSKPVGRVDDIKRVHRGNPHNFLILRNNATISDTNGKIIVGPFNENGPVDVAVLHHYHWKSAKEYVLKKQRGRSDIGHDQKAVTQAEESLAKALASNRLPSSINASTANDGETIFDDSAWQFLKRNDPGYALLDKALVELERKRD